MDAVRKYLRNEKILVTGPAGRVAFPLVKRLAQDNEVWGIARFGNAGDRDRVEAVGARTRVVDLAAPDWADLPGDFTIVLHFAAAIGIDLGFDEALCINSEGTGRLMSRFREARACLVTSSRSIYAEPEDPRHAVLESDPIGGNAPISFAPTYRVSKLGQEAVARFCAETFGLPTTIARLNVVYGDNGGLPAMLLDSMLAGQPIALKDTGHTLCSPIHHDDLYDQLKGLLSAASVPATITNWAGDESVDLRDLCRYMGDLVGREVSFVPSAEIAGNSASDPTRRRTLAGACRVDWREGIHQMISVLHPEIRLRDPD
ncbi:MAG: epimerase [Deltaproteobacteria bacterium]|jgi:nucleoside-diphosphate-sugar epimerase|nr:epimerase [Deltaproteobacteria bacterium]